MPPKHKGSSAAAAGGGGGGAAAAAAIAGGEGGFEVAADEMDMGSNPLVAQMNAEQQRLVDEIVKQTNYELDRTKSVAPDLDTHLERVAFQLVATDKLLGQCNLEAPDDVLAAVIDANTKIVSKEFTTFGFAKEFAKRIFSNSTPTDFKLLHIGCQAVKVAAVGGSTLIMAAECLNRASIITRVFNSTLGNTDMLNFISQLGSFMSDPTQERYNEFQKSNPVAFGILKGVADISTIENFIFVAHLCLSEYAKQQQPDPAAAGGGAPAAAGGGAPAAAAAPAAPAPSGLKSLVFNQSKKVGKLVVGAVNNVFSFPTSCLVGVGSDPEMFIAGKLNDAGMSAFWATTCYLQKKDISVQDFMTRIQSAVRFGDCYDSIGLDPRLVSICIMMLRSDRRRGILSSLMETQSCTMTDAIGMLKLVYPGSLRECPTSESLSLLEREFPNGHQNFESSHWSTEVASDSPLADWTARLRDLTRFQEKEWTYVDFLMEMAADLLRNVSTKVVDPALAIVGVMLVRDAAPASTVNPLLKRRDLAEAVSRVLPEKKVFDEQCDIAKAAVVRNLMEKGMSKEDAERAAHNCKMHIQWAYGNKRELVLTKDGNLVYQMCADPVESVESRLREYKCEAEEAKLKGLGMTHRSVFGFFRRALIAGYRHISGSHQEPEEPEQDVIAFRPPHIAPCELLPLLIAFPPPSSSSDVVNIAAADGEGLESAAADGEGLESVAASSVDGGAMEQGSDGGGGGAMGQGSDGGGGGVAMDQGSTVVGAKKGGSKSRKNTKRTRRHNKGRKSSKAAKKTQQRRSSRHRRSSRKGRK